MHGVDGLRSGAVVATVIAGGGLGVAVAHQFLHGDNVGAVVEQLAGEGAAAVMRRQGGDAGLGGAGAENIVDGCWRNAKLLDVATAPDPGDERAGPRSAQGKPVIEGGIEAGGHGHVAAGVVFAGDPKLSVVIVPQLQACHLGTAQTGEDEATNYNRIAWPCCAPIAGARAEQGIDLAVGDGSACGLVGLFEFDAAHAGGAMIVLGADEFHVPGGAQRAAHGRQGFVGGGRLAMRDQPTAQGIGVDFAHLPPGQGAGVTRAAREHPGAEVERADHGAS